MHLQQMEIQGFKSFAKKTVFEFIPPQSKHKGITGIVGPNGSGKSNVADAIRWVLGEQSLKTIRGKKSQDVIFSGSANKSRLGFAQVTLTLNNEDGTITPGPEEEDSVFDYSEIAITRRVYRSGESEYLINNQTVRLADIQLLLARAHFAQKTYTVIGQGMIDHMLMASAAERKQFFDEAAGIKEFQIKRHRSTLKLHATKENLHETKMLLQEIAPRLSSLTRQVKRLEKRESVEQQLKEKYLQYYGAQWVESASQYKEALRKHGAAQEASQSIQKQYDVAFEKMREMEVAETDSDTYTQLQKEYEQVYAKRSSTKEELLRLTNAMEVAKMRAQNEAKWTPLPLSKIIMELETVQAELKGHAAQKDQSVLTRLLGKISKRVSGLIDRLQKPAPEKRKPFIDTKIKAQILELEKTLVLLEEEVAERQARMQAFSKDEQKKKSSFFELQRELQTHQSALHEAQRKLSDAAVQLARVETRQQALSEEIDREVLELKDEIIAQKPSALRSVVVSDVQHDVYRLRRQLELIGSIDEEIIEEYAQTQERYSFLTEQVEDLDGAMHGLQKVIASLDDVMRTKRKSAFAAINKEFDRYFKLLFDGGKAGIVQIKQEPRPRPVAETNDEQHVHDVDALEHELDEAAAEELAGIDIHATPPGKRIADVSVLSGGERAMASVALLCAILSINPSPFVVLDEVDAALDESNSLRFSKILEELASKTQFIVISHNRATMEAADVLYGITMGDDGVSRMLSVKLEQAQAQAAR